MSPWVGDCGGSLSTHHPLSIIQNPPIHQSGNPPFIIQNPSIHHPPPTRQFIPLQSVHSFVIAYSNQQAHPAIMKTNLLLWIVLLICAFNAAAVDVASPKMSLVFNKVKQPKVYLEIIHDNSVIVKRGVCAFAPAGMLFFMKRQGECDVLYIYYVGFGNRQYENIAFYCDPGYASYKIIIDE